MHKIGMPISKKDQEIFDKWLPLSTYEVDSNSDADEYHITKPFEHRGLSPLEYLKQATNFEDDESYKGDESE